MTTATCSCCSLPILSCGRRPELDVANPRQAEPMSQSLATWLANLWVTSDFEGDCSICGDRFYPGEEIRATGTGEWQGSCCHGED